MALNDTDLLIVDRAGVNYKAPISQLDSRYQARGTSVSGTSFNGGSVAGFRNKIINGNFIIDQRYEGGVYSIPSNSSFYTVDRWAVVSYGSTITAQMVANSAEPRQNIFRLTGSAGNTNIGIAQRIESFNCVDIAGKQVTFSFDMANTVRTSINWKLTYPNTNDNYSSLFVTFETGTITVTSTLTRYFFTVTLPAQCNRGFQLAFDVNNQTSGTWSIGNVQVELGTLATPFERRPPSIEQLLCKRYFQYCPVSLYGTAASSGSVMEAPVPYPVSMRILPTVGAIQIDPSPGTAPQVNQVATVGISRRTVEYACPYIQANNAGSFFVVGYRYPLDSEI